MLTSAQIRQQFIDYFAEKHRHTFVPSSPVVPHDDPTLMFANAGMNQFKDVFLGTGSREYSRAANTQKCIRAGGKHNDLDDVGKDTYHHTFFEMLGNWSFGDYFKKEAITWAWDLLTNVWGVEGDRLHATYFEGDESEGLEPDNEAKTLWEAILPPERIHPGNKKDNFWEMGDTGPCGPCSELHIDLTPDKSGGHLINKDDARVIEIWNLVFIQFNRDTSGKLSILPAKHVDTGMGFERITAVLQQKTSNYDTDVWSPIFAAISKVTDTRPYQGGPDTLSDPIDTAYRVIADHIRTLTFALADGAHCGNSGRSSVLRTVLRRAVRFGHQQLGVEETFFYKLVPTVVDQLGAFFPELAKNPKAIEEELKSEEQEFRKTLARGIGIFESQVKEMTAGESLDGKTAFDLEATHGFPISLTQVMAEERKLSVDMVRYAEAKKEHEEISRGAKDSIDVTPQLIEIIQKHKSAATEFLGYDETNVLRQAELQVFTLTDGRTALLTNATPFYGEAGGQVGDTGSIKVESGSVYQVTDTRRLGDVYLHLCNPTDGADGNTKAAARRVTMTVNSARRAAITANHTATHILNHKLRAVLGDHVAQKGSLVDDEKTRFDFSHNAALADEQIEQIETQVNHDIGADLPVYTEYAPQEDAIKINSLRAVFGEKYPPTVRVVSIGVPVKDLLANPDNADWMNYSIEFCGGTHLPKTGDAEGFVIISEEGIAKGVRRITGITGQTAHKAQAEADMLLNRVNLLQNAQEDQLETKLTEILRTTEEATLPYLTKRKIQAGIAKLNDRVKEHKKELAKAASGNVIESARAIAEQQSAPLVIANVQGADAKTLRDAMDVIRKKHPEAALLLGTATGDKCAFLAAVPKELIAKGLKAGDWVREVAQAAGGGGGGRPDMAQAGGKDVAKLDEALEVGRAFAEKRIGE